MGAYEVMKGQAGNRLIVKWKMRDQGATRTSHFTDLQEFLDNRTKEAQEWNDHMEWYEVNGVRTTV